ncbi:hypothetical protein F5Y12DRAFT_784656 [Xylaria sp. FL1777]|nr:hypothetical protein F5Y12DRAFT_784656 [Xylaria sp. FL1777]
MEVVSIFCSRCDHALGGLLNLWTQIGKGYISPVVQAEAALDMSPEGPVQHGEKGTIVDNCRIQGLVCAQCRSTLGSKCLSSAVNHVLHEGSLLLRISSVRIMNPNGHVAIKPNIQRVLSLKNPPVHDSQDDDHSSAFSEDYSHAEAADENPRLSHILHKINAQGEKIEKLDTTGYQIVASFNQSVQHIDETIRNLKNDMAQVTGDLSDNSSKTRRLTDDILTAKTEIKEIKKVLQPLSTQSHLEREPSSIKNAAVEANASLRAEFNGTLEKQQQKLNVLGSEIENIGRDLKGFQSLLEAAQATANAALSASNANTQEIIALKTELEQTKQELALERSYKSSSSNPVFASREMDILTSNITKIGHRASQVETLQMEFELLKGRVQRMEAQAPTWQRDSTTGLQRQEPQHSHSVNPKHNTSSSYYMEDSLNCNIPSSTAQNAIENNVSWSSSPTTLQSALGSPPSTKAPRNAPRISVPRLTKSGAVDKRSLRKSSSKLAAAGRKANKS